MVNVAAPPCDTVDMLDEMVRVGVTDDVIVTDAVLGVPTTYDVLGVNETVSTRLDSTTLFVTVGMATCIEDWPAGTTMLPPGIV